MAKPSDHPKFKKLLEKWNQKLYRSGFRDIEKTIDECVVLKYNTGTIVRYRKLDSNLRETKSEFFTRVSNRVDNTSFKNDLERQIMVLYSEGNSQAEIKKILKIEGHRCKVYLPIYKWLKEWGLK